MSCNVSWISLRGTSGTAMALRGHCHAGPVAAIVIGFLTFVRRRGIGNKDIPPAVHRARQHLVDIDHAIGKVFVKHLFLHFRTQLGGLEGIEYLLCGPGRVGRKPERSGGGDQHGQRRERQNRRDHAAAGNSGGAHGDDFAVAGHAAERDHHAGQNAQRQGERKRERNREHEQMRHQSLGDAELRTRISNSFPMRCKNSTKVNIADANRALLETSRKTERNSRPIVSFRYQTDAVLRARAHW